MSLVKVFDRLFAFIKNFACQVAAILEVRFLGGHGSSTDDCRNNCITGDSCDSAAKFFFALRDQESSSSLWALRKDIEHCLNLNPS